MATEFKFGLDGKVRLYEPIGAPVRWHGLYKYLEPSSNWRVQTQSDTASSSRIFALKESESGWRIFKQDAFDSKWYICAPYLEALSSWKIWNEFGFDFKWYIRAPNLESTSSWKIWNEPSFFSSWLILHDDYSRLSSWRLSNWLRFWSSSKVASGGVKFKNPSTDHVNWYQITSSPIYWKGLWSELYSVSSYKILTQDVFTSSWRVQKLLTQASSSYIATLLSSDLSWRVMHQDNYLSGSRIQASSTTPIGWYIKGEMTSTSMWNVFGLPTYKCSWRIKHPTLTVLSSWVCEGTDDGPILITKCHQVDFQKIANSRNMEFKVTPVESQFQSQVIPGVFSFKADPVIVDDSDTVTEDLVQISPVEEDAESGSSDVEDTSFDADSEEVLDFFKATQVQYNLYLKNPVEYNKQCITLHNTNIKVIPLGFQFFAKRK